MRERRPFVILKAATSLDGCIAEAPGERTALTSARGQPPRARVRAEVDAIGVGVGTILVDDPQLTARGVYRERPLTRVIFDRRLRTPPAARVLSTRDAGPVIIVTTPRGADRADAAQAARSARARRSKSPRDGRLRRAASGWRSAKSARCCSKAGAALHAAAWDEGRRRLRAALRHAACARQPRRRAAGGPRRSPSADLHERRVEPLGPDVLIEGYVHRPG